MLMIRIASTVSTYSGKNSGIINGNMVIPKTAITIELKKVNNFNFLFGLPLASCVSMYLKTTLESSIKTIQN